MTPEQLQADLTLGGWVPVQYVLDKGDVWKGLYKEGTGLVYVQTHGPIAGMPRYFPEWPVEDHRFVRELRCRWEDMTDHLRKFAEFIEEKGL